MKRLTLKSIAVLFLAIPTGVVGSISSAATMTMTEYLELIKGPVRAPQLCGKSALACGDIFPESMDDSGRWIDRSSGSTYNASDLISRRPTVAVCGVKIGDRGSIHLKNGTIVEGEITGFYLMGDAEFTSKDKIVSIIPLNLICR